MASGYVVGGVANALPKSTPKKSQGESELQALFSRPNLGTLSLQQSHKGEKKGKKRKKSDSNSTLAEEVLSKKKISSGGKTPPKRKATDSTLPGGNPDKDPSSPAKKKKLSKAEADVPKIHVRFPEDVEKKTKKDRIAQRENRKKKKSRECHKRTIFVGNLPNTITKAGLKQLFKKYGAIESVRFRSAMPADLKLSKKAVITTKAFNKVRQTFNGYVIFVETEAAEKALESNGTIYENVHLRVDMAKNTTKVDNKRSVFVGNLPFDIEEDALREHFKDCGTVDNVRIIRDSRTGLGKGFGYILFDSKDGVLFATKLNEMKFKGRELRVLKAVDKGKDSTKGKKDKKTRKAGHTSTTPPESTQSAQKTKRQSFGRNMPTNILSKEFQGAKAKQLSKIKKKQKLKKEKMKKKKEAVKLGLNLAQKSTGNKIAFKGNKGAGKPGIKETKKSKGSKIISARNRIAKSMKKKK